MTSGKSLLQKTPVLFIFISILLATPTSRKCLHADENQTLKFGYSSSQNPAILIRRMTPLMNILSEALGVNIDFVQKKTYSEMQKAYINQEIDFGIINAYSFIRILPYNSILPIAARRIENSRNYQTYFFARKDSGINDINDLRGKSVALGDPYSTSSYLIPHYIFRKNGIHPDSDFLETIIISKQDSLILSVLNRTADVGVSASFIFNEQPEKIKSLLNVFIISESFPLGPFIVNKNLSPETVEKIKEVLFSLQNNEAGKRALKVSEIEGFEEVDVEDYQPLIEIVKTMNIN